MLPQACALNERSESAKFGCACRFFVWIYAALKKKYAIAETK
jgi:hypothetical protein